MKPRPESSDPDREPRRKLGPIIKFKEFRARKSHACSECHNHIAAKSQYVVYTDSRGGFRRRKLCSVCSSEIRGLISSGITVPFGQLKQVRAVLP